MFVSIVNVFDTEEDLSVHFFFFFFISVLALWRHIFLHMPAQLLFLNLAQFFQNLVWTREYLGPA